MTTTPQAALLSEAERCAKNLNKWNANDDCWSPEHIRARSEAELRRLDALVAHLTADRDDTANELALRTKHNLALTNERDQLLARLQATQEPVQTTDPWDHDFIAGRLPRRPMAPVEPAQAGELPEPDAVFYCSEDTGYLTQYRNPPSNLTDGDVAMYEADTVRSLISAAPAARKPLTGLTREQMEAGRHQVFSTNNPFCPCDSKTFRKVSEWTEREFCRINDLEVKP